MNNSLVFAVGCVSMKMDLCHLRDQIQTYDNIEYINTHLLIYGPDILYIEI